MTGGAVFHLLAGPNGAGKSTLYRALVLDEAGGPTLVAYCEGPRTTRLADAMPRWAGLVLAD